MLSPLAQQAIKAALEGHWEEAIEYNQALLATNPYDIDSLNRLARAYAKTGQIKSAKATYQTVLKFDRYNPIAKKSLEKLALASPQSNSLPPATLFIEEPGKTKTVKLTRVTNAKTLSSLTAGEPVFLAAKKHSVTITTQSGLYLGVLPDDLSHRLTKLIRSGNKYSAVVRTAAKGELAVFIQETWRSKRLRQTPSF